MKYGSEEDYVGSREAMEKLISTFVAETPAGTDHRVVTEALIDTYLNVGPPWESLLAMWAIATADLVLQRVDGYPVERRRKKPRGTTTE